MNSRIVIAIALLLSSTSQLVGQEYCFIKFARNESGPSPFYEPVCGRSPDSYEEAAANAEAVAKGMGLKDPIGGWEEDCSFSKCLRDSIPDESVPVNAMEIKTVLGSPCAAGSEWEVEFTVYCTNGTSILPLRMPGNSYCSAYCAAKKGALQIAELSGCAICHCTSRITKRPAPICCPTCCPVICR